MAAHPTLSDPANDRALRRPRPFDPDPPGARTTLPEGAADGGGFAQALEFIPVALLITDTHGRIEYVNRQFTALTGYSVTEARGRNVRKFEPPGMAPDASEAFWRKLERGEEWRGEYHSRRKDGGLYWEAVSFVPLRDALGQATRFVVVREDITERKLVEVALPRETSSVSLLQQVAVVIHQASSVREAIQEALGLVCRHAGYPMAYALMLSREEGAGAAAGFWHIEDLPRWGPLRAAMPEGLRLETCPLARRVLAAGKLGWSSELGDALAQAGCEAGRAAGLRSAVAAPVIADSDNQAVLLFLRTEAEAPDWRWMERVSDVAEQLSQAFQRRLAQDRLRRAHERLRQILASLPCILIGLDEHGRVTHWNHAAEKAFGTPAMRALGEPLDRCGFSWTDEQVKRAMAEARASGAPVKLTDVPFGERERPRFINITFCPVAGDAAAAGPAPGLMFFGVETTEYKAMEFQLNQAQKLESIGRLAAGIAHEINTPTQYVGDNVSFFCKAYAALEKLLEQYARLLAAAREGPLDARQLEAVEEAVRNADLPYLTAEIPKALAQTREGLERITHIVRAMREFSHPSTEEKTPADLNRAIETTLTVARSEWKQVAEMVLELDPALPPVACLPGEFNQAILNLVTNAAHAIADVVGSDGARKGRITISSRRDGEWAEVRIADTGTGIPEAIRDKIFDPFFTTKEVGRGTGQGLYIARSVVVDKHGGTLTFETKMGEGTTFIIRLPLGVLSRAPEGSAPAGEAQPAESRKEADTSP